MSGAWPDARDVELATRQGSRGSLLLVDDVPENLDLLTAVLLQDYHVRAVTSGERALQAVAIQPPDLILLDVMMPGMDGFEVLRRLKSNPRTTGIPVIFVTAATDGIDEERGLESGAVDYIHKPVVGTVVLARVRAQLEAYAARLLLERTNERLVRKVAEGSHALEEAQRQFLQAEKLTAMGLLAAGVAHEISHPVTAIDANVAALEDCVNDLQRLLDAYEAAPQSGDAESSAKIRELKKEIEFPLLIQDTRNLFGETREAVTWVRTIVRDLEGLSRADDDEWRWTDLHQVLDAALNIARNELKHRCTVRKEYGKLPLVHCLSSRLGQVFLDLIVNAAHAIEGTGEITLKTEVVDAQTVCVSVADTGRGIPDDVLPKIFEPFFTTKLPGEGTGLGLPTALRIIDVHGGRIDVQSQVGNGTVFFVTLPISTRR